MTAGPVQVLVLGFGEPHPDGSVLSELRRLGAAGVVRLVDTAGLRKRARVTEKLEQMSTAATIAALKECEVAVLVVAALLGMDEQDLRIARLAEREGRAVVIALNKWDAVEDRALARKRLEDVLTASLAQSKGLPVVPMSAANGRGHDRRQGWMCHAREISGFGCLPSRRQPVRDGALSQTSLSETHPTLAVSSSMIRSHVTARARSSAG